MRTKYITIKPHEKTNSNKINNIQHSGSEDIADLYKSYLSSKNDIEVHNLMIPMVSDNITAEIDTIKATLSTFTTKTMLHTFYDTSKTRYPTDVEETFRCKQEYLYGEVVLPIASTTIEYHYIDPVSGERSLITNLDHYVHSFLTNNRYKPKVDDIYENSHINAIDQKTNKMHLVKALTRNSEVMDIDIVYNLEAQETSTYNTLRIFPIPEMIAAYKSISFSGPSKSEARITDWEGTEIDFLDESNNPINKARKKTFRFPDDEISSLSIVLNNDTYTMVDGNTKEFILGARLISLEYNTYLVEGYIGIEIDSTDQTAIEQIIPEYEGEPTNIDVFVFTTEESFNSTEGYVISGNATTIQAKPQINIGSAEKIYVLFKLNKHDNNTTPVLKGCVIKWAQ